MIQRGPPTRQIRVHPGVVASRRDLRRHSPPPVALGPGRARQQGRSAGGTGTGSPMRGSTMLSLAGCGRDDGPVAAFAPSAQAHQHVHGGRGMRRRVRRAAPAFENRRADRIVGHGDGLERRAQSDRFGVEPAQAFEIARCATSIAFASVAWLARGHSRHRRKSPQARDCRCWPGRSCRWQAQERARIPANTLPRLPVGTT